MLSRHKGVRNLLALALKLYIQCQLLIRYNSHEEADWKRRGSNHCIGSIGSIGRIGLSKQAVSVRDRVEQKTFVSSYQLSLPCNKSLNDFIGPMKMYRKKRYVMYCRWQIKLTLRIFLLSIPPVHTHSLNRYECHKRKGFIIYII